MGETSRVTKRRLQRFFENGLKRIRNNQADEYSETKTYAVGDYCIYNNTLYKCTKAVSTAGPFTASSWKQTTVASEIDSLYTNLNRTGTVQQLLDKGTSTSWTGAGAPPTGTKNAILACNNFITTMPLTVLQQYDSGSNFTRIDGDGSGNAYAQFIYSEGHIRYICVGGCTASVWVQF